MYNYICSFNLILINFIMLMTFLMVRHWAFHILDYFTWDYSFKFRARFIVLTLSLRDPSRRLCYWTGWDPKELVRAALSTDSFFEVWEVFTPGVNI